MNEPTDSVEPVLLAAIKENASAWTLGVLFRIKMIFSGWTRVYIGRSANQVVSDVGSVG